ncbi:MAG: YhjD/YihY/BrkB family envelope integrity protein, partial [Flavisolibacter sp.]
MKRTGTFFTLLKRSAISFSDDNAFKLSASLSYYTIFALGPLLFIIISLSGFFYGNEAMQGRIYEQLKGLIGNDAALQVQNIIANASQDYDS